LGEALGRSLQPSGFFLGLLPWVEIDYLGFEVVVKPDETLFI